jgi:ubiquinone/menaquinone biosynthesis C-methylase UbiE
MTKAMINKANENNKKPGYYNVEFRLGDIENIPVNDNTRPLQGERFYFRLRQNPMKNRSLLT